MRQKVEWRRSFNKVKWEGRRFLYLEVSKEVGLVRLEVRLEEEKWLLPPEETRLLLGAAALGVRWESGGRFVE